jgi:hypothetical protein
MLAVGKKMLGKNYDTAFAWDGRRIYCSELVYRIFLDGAGLPLGKVQRFGELALDSKPVRRLIKVRRGHKLDLDEPIITPVSIMTDSKLRTVASF